MTTEPDVAAGPLSERLDLAHWPGRERREPAPSSRGWLALAPLVAALRSAIAVEFAGRRDLRVLDIGCGDKPYLPLLAPYAASYRGLDTHSGPHVDDVGSAEALPYGDGEFDVVLCTQVLEHVLEPAAVLDEIRRVLASGGVAFVSTHGVFVYHPSPPEQGHDYWRWTHRGLERQFAATGRWDDLRVLPCGEWLACLFYIACQAVDPNTARLGERARRLVVGAFNRLGSWLDDRVPAVSRTPRPGSMSANYLVVARKPAG